MPTLPAFDWDDEKNRANKRVHQLSFEKAAEIWEGPLAIKADKRQDYGENRFNAMGLLPDTQRVVNVTFTVRDGKIRIISARYANSRERKVFYANRP